MQRRDCVYSPGPRFIYHGHQKKFLEARETCLSTPGYQLAMTKNIAQYMAVTQFLETLGVSDPVWLGLTDVSSSGESG